MSTVLTGCTERDHRLAGILDEDAILDQHPPGATQVEQWADCDSDDGFAYAGRDYRSDLDRDGIIAFYRQAAPQVGWTVTAENPPPRPDALVVTAGLVCFSKDIDGTVAHLGISFPSDLNVPPHLAGPDNPLPPPHPHDVYSIELRGSHDGDLWC